MRTITFIIAALALAPVAAQSQTIDQRDNPTVIQRVKTSDIDLQSPAGRAILTRRVGTAVTNVCQPAVLSKLLMPTEVLRCRAAASRGAQLQVAALETSGSKLASR